MQTVLPHRRLAARAMAGALAIMLAGVAAPAACAPLQALLQPCAACHGATGNTMSAALYPNLAGQSAAYIALQLNNFRSGERPRARAATVRRDKSSKRFRASQRSRPATPWNS
ncbi:c-type cytochrome [Massilia sp. P8910]|uniref:c-type cytochrome n=1 Tax=Massilia antarctica TaxID=2765360 RepID=UPI001E64A052|nr:c-type cytochrome [Massilia antarctica]MCE3604268.1 c-type cytochrome [Massilia antarctica]